MPAPRSLTIASVNVNGLRAAVSNGMPAWAAGRRPAVITMQEVRAPDEVVSSLVQVAAGDGWHVAHSQATAKGRAGVAIASRAPIRSHRRGLPPAGAGAVRG
ncbi:MAG: endonuclease/exonuclease/phosphatase family protein, partial [Actinomycetota bacterium]